MRGKIMRRGFYFGLGIEELNGLGERMASVPGFPQTPARLQRDGKGLLLERTGEDGRSARRRRRTWTGFGAHTIPFYTGARPSSTQLKEVKPPSAAGDVRPSIKAARTWVDLPCSDCHT